MNGLIGLVFVVLVVCFLFSGGGSSSRAGRSASGRSVTVRGHAGVHKGGGPHQASRHEAGHVAGAHGVGGKVRSARVYRDGSGLVRATVPDARSAIVFLLAGQIAHGSKAGAGGDDAAVRRTLREFPKGERRSVLAGATQDARRIVRSRSGQIDRDSRTLDKRGQL